MKFYSAVVKNADLQKKNTTKLQNSCYWRREAQQTICCKKIHIGFQVCLDIREANGRSIWFFKNIIDILIEFLIYQEPAANSIFLRKLVAKEQKLKKNRLKHINCDRLVGSFIILFEFGCVL